VNAMSLQATSSQHFCFIISNTELVAKWICDTETLESFNEGLIILYNDRHLKSMQVLWHISLWKWKEVLVEEEEAVVLWLPHDIFLYGSKL
jgi:hypothetical protein